VLILGTTGAACARVRPTWCSWPSTSSASSPGRCLWGWPW